jgi:hypothetical protein
MLPQLAKLKATMSDRLLSALPPLEAVTFEPHDWPQYIPYRLRIGTFHDPEDGAHNLPAWAYLHLKDSARAPVTMELGAHADLGGDDEMNWELYYENIKHVDNGDDDDDPVQLCVPFSVEKSRSDLLALVKYYFLLAADAGLFPGKGIAYNESFAQSMRAICRRVLRKMDGGSTSGNDSSPIRDVEPVLRKPVTERGYDTSMTSSTKRLASSLISESSESDGAAEERYQIRKTKSRLAKRLAMRLCCPGSDEEDEKDEQDGMFFKDELRDLSSEKGRPANIPIGDVESGNQSQHVKQGIYYEKTCFPVRVAGRNYQGTDALLERSEQLNLHIDSLRAGLAAKLAEKRDLDAKLYRLLRDRSDKEGSVSRD